MASETSQPFYIPVWGLLVINSGIKCHVNELEICTLPCMPKANVNLRARVKNIDGITYIIIFVILLMTCTSPTFIKLKF